MRKTFYLLWNKLSRKNRFLNLASIFSMVFKGDEITYVADLNSCVEEGQKLAVDLFNETSRYRKAYQH